MRAILVPLCVHPSQGSNHQRVDTQSIVPEMMGDLLKYYCETVFEIAINYYFCKK